MKIYFKTREAMRNASFGKQADQGKTAVVGKRWAMKVTVRSDRSPYKKIGGGA